MKSPLLSLFLSKKNRYFAGIVLCLLCFKINILSQNAPLNNSLLDSFRQLKTTDQRRIFLSDTNVVKMTKQDFDAILSIIKLKNDELSTFYWYFQYNRLINHFDSTNIQETIAKNQAEMLKIAQKKGYEPELLTTQFYYGKKLPEQESYSMYINIFDQIKALGYKKFRNYSIHQMLFELGRNFYELGDTEKALECLLQAEKESQKYYFVHIHTLILNLIEAIYADKKEYSNAITYAQKIYDANDTLEPSRIVDPWLHTFWKGLACLDIGQYLFDMGKIKESEYYANRGYELYKNEKYANVSGILMAEFDALQVLIKLKLRLGKLDEVKTLFNRVEYLKPRMGLGMESDYFRPLKLYQNYVEYYESQKDYTHAFQYLKLANQLQDSLNRRNDKRKLWQTEMRVKADRYRMQLQSAEEDSHLQQKLRNFALFGMLLIAGAAFIIYRRIKKDNRIIEQQKTLLEQSLSEKETLLKEVHHRVKNNLQIISGLFDKQARKATDETTRKLMREGQDRVFSIALVHQNLYQSENLSTMEIKQYLELLINNIQKTHATERKNVQILTNVDDSVVNVDTAIPLGLILNELITNCFKYAFQDRDGGTIHIDFHQSDKQIFLSVKDNGVGLPPDFDIKKTSSLGLSLVNGLVRQLNGSLNYLSNNQGTTFNITCAP